MTVPAVVAFLWSSLVVIVVLWIMPLKPNWLTQLCNFIIGPWFIAACVFSTWASTGGRL